MITRPIRELFVDGTGGNDVNDGLSLANAKATIMGASGIQSIWQTGDHVHIMNGSYAENVVIPAIGVTLEGHGLVNINPASGNGLNANASLEGTTLLNLNVTSVDANGVLARNTPGYMHIENCRIEAGNANATFALNLETGDSPTTVKNCFISSGYVTTDIEGGDQVIFEGCYFRAANPSSTTADLMCVDGSGNEQVIFRDCRFEATRTDAVTAGRNRCVDRLTHAVFENCSFEHFMTNGGATADAQVIRTFASGGTQLSNCSIVHINSGSGTTEHIESGFDAEINVINSRIDDNLVSTGSGRVIINGAPAGNTGGGGGGVNGTRQLFVDGTNGNDSNDGHTLDTAKATFTGTSGIDTIWQDGDFVHVMPATYAENVVVNQAVTIQGHGLANFATAGTVFDLTSAGEGTVLRNLTISSTNGVAIDCRTTNQNVLLEDLTVSGGSGLADHALQVQINDGVSLVVRNSHFDSNCDVVHIDNGTPRSDQILFEHCSFDAQTPAAVGDPCVCVLGNSVEDVIFRDCRFTMARTDNTTSNVNGCIQDLLNVVLENCHMTATISGGTATGDLEVIDTLNGSCYQIENCSIQATNAGSGANEHIVAAANAEVNVINTKVDSSLVSSGAGTVNLNGFPMAGLTAAQIANVVQEYVTTGKIIYVDNVSGLAGNDGRTRATARDTIANGLALCADGDTLMIIDNLVPYSENITLTLNHLTIKSTDKASWISAAGTTLTINGHYCHLEGIDFGASAGNTAVSMGSPNPPVAINCGFNSNLSGLGTALDITAGLTPMRCINCDFRGSGGVCVDLTAGKIHMDGCEIIMNTPPAVGDTQIAIDGNGQNHECELRNTDIYIFRSDAFTSTGNFVLDNMVGMVENCRLRYDVNSGGATGDFTIVRVGNLASLQIKDSVIEHLQSGSGANVHLDVDTGGQLTVQNSIYDPDLVTHDGQFHTDRPNP